MINEITLNITELCNLKCGFCPRSTWYPNQNLNMSSDTIHAICNQILKLPNFKDFITNGSLRIIGRGEPTLHPEFDKIIEIISSYNIDNIVLYTNGIKLKKIKHISHKIKQIRWAVYSDNDADFIEAISEIKTYNSKNKLVFMKPDNEKEGGTVRHYFINGTLFLNSNYPFLDNRAGSIENPIYEKHFNYKHATYHDGKKCYYIDNKIYIDWNGNYNLCCNDWSGRVLGNIFKEDIISYYEKNNILKKYKEGIKNKKPLNPCKSCSILTCIRNNV